jgi:RNA polymerase-binding transcription factor
MKASVYVLYQAKARLFEQRETLRRRLALGGYDCALERELRKVELAVARIEQDSYGVCLYCGYPIEAPRLAALPYTESCAQCSCQNWPGRERTQPRAAA